MALRLLLVSLVALVGCAGPADPDPRAHERMRAAAAPLLSAHDRLDTYGAAVAEGGDYARARALWPDVADDVGALVDGFDVAAATGLGPQQRSTLIGYLGGLRAGLAAWEQVDRAIRADQVGAEADVDAREQTAREHMRFLADLRSRSFGDGQRSG